MSPLFRRSDQSKAAPDQPTRILMKCDSCTSAKDPRPAAFLKSAWTIWAGFLLSIITILVSIVWVASHKERDDILQSIAYLTVGGASLGGLGTALQLPRLLGKADNAVKFIGNVFQLVGFSCGYPALVYMTAEQAIGNPRNFVFNALGLPICTLGIVFLILLTISIYQAIRPPVDQSLDSQPPPASS